MKVARHPAKFPDVSSKKFVHLKVGYLESFRFSVSARVGPMYIEHDLQIVKLILILIPAAEIHNIRVDWLYCADTIFVDHSFNNKDEINEVEMYERSFYTET